MTPEEVKETLMKIGVLLGQVAPHDKELYMALAEAVGYCDRVKEGDMKTYGDIYNEFCDKFPNAEAVDWRPAVKLYIPQLSKDIPNAIIIWLNDGTKVIYGAEVGVISKIKHEIEVVTRGNCMLCGKELTDGLFICKDCASKQKPETVTEFADRCRECGAKYGKLLKTRHWIPVSEPPEDGTWNFFTDGNMISVERYKADALDHFYPEGRWFSFDEAVGWLPLSELPNPYKNKEVSE